MIGIMSCPLLREFRFNGLLNRQGPPSPGRVRHEGRVGEKSVGVSRAPKPLTHFFLEPLGLLSVIFFGWEILR